MTIDILPNSIQAKGGLKYELVLALPTINTPPKKCVLPPCLKELSLQDIEKKLKAAEKRRTSIEMIKINASKEKDVAIVEKKDKRSEFDENFKEFARESLEKKMDSFKEKRENFIKSIQEKIRVHEKHVNEVRRVFKDHFAQLKDKMNEKLKTADEKRIAIQKHLQDKLKDHERRVIEVRQNKLIDISFNGSN